MARIAWLALALAACGGARTAQVKTVAGQPEVCGFADGVGRAALFNVPAGVAVRADGTVLVADFQNFRVRAVDRAGAVTTIAGSDGGAGRVVDGSGGGAGFAYPSALGLDAAGLLYVFDHCALRTVDAAGRVATLAGGRDPDGTPRCGLADGSGAAARFDDGGYGGGLAVGGDGNIYVADYGNAAIRKVTPAGMVTTLAGGGGRGYADGNGAQARFAGPTGVAVAADGVVYVADLDNGRIRALAPNGDVSTLAGSGALASTDGQGTAASLAQPWGVALASGGDLYVAESRGNRIRRVTRAGAVTTFAGAGFDGTRDGPADQATFYSPGQLAFAENGDLYVVDQGGCVLRVVTR